ncbi:Macrolide export protein MacA [Novipirellula galeiformis]|uniref:Macrolide export protein MacA n=1 Tax=Novipirellula galeiformis TaxID=2528004 RepID=A0A5C6CK02_9BACT|nr:efflux RND transporter periplasmic adaptor subunit [Novipirellula galeiformis]TWU25193.1 Macrolide export protein MacA [Novipirellula galeiformis]
MSKRWVKARRFGWRLFQLVLLAAVIGGAVYWMKFSPIPVAEHPVERGRIVSEVMGTGTLEARVEATISPKISGRIKRVLSDQGERVVEDDLLVELDDEELQQQVAIADANVAASRAAIARLMADKDRATAAYTQAKSSHDRNEKLAVQSAVSQDELDRSSEALAVALTGISRAEAAIMEGQKELVAAEKTLDYHRARLEDCHIHAPFDGMIVSRNRELGDVVVPGTSIMRLISLDQIWVSAWVDETEMAKLDAEQPARIVFRSDPSQAYTGKVVRLGIETDRETREFIVDIDALELPKNWAVGQRADAYIEVARKDDVVRLLGDLIVNRDGHTGVFIVVNHRAVWRPVMIGLRNRNAVEVVDGLQPGDVVITPTNRSDVLNHGRKVVSQ